MLFVLCPDRTQVKDGRTIEPRRRPSSTSISFYVDINSVSVSDILMTVGISAICILLYSDNYNSYVVASDKLQTMSG